MAEELIELLDTQPRTYDDIHGAYLHFTQQGIADNAGRWLSLYRIKRDGLWSQHGFESQDEWCEYLETLTPYEGYCARSMLFQKSAVIERLVDAGVEDKWIVHSLTQPTATKKLLDNPDKIPDGQTIQAVIASTENDSPVQASDRVTEVLGLREEWIPKLMYNMKKGQLILPICEKDEEGVIETRQYIICPIPYEDVQFLAKILRKHLEVT